MSKDISEISKEFGSMIEEAQNPPLAAKFVELQMAISELLTEKGKLEETIPELQKKLDSRNDLKWVPEKKLYHREKDPIPFCPRCKESRQKEVHLLPRNAPQGAVVYACPLCQQQFPAPWK